MKKTKKALASLAIAGMVMTMVPFNAFANGAIPTRLAGYTAEDTAVQIADATGYTGTAILASSTSYGMVDALTAGPLASYLKAPILLTGAGATLDAATKAELTKLGVTRVYVTSGTAVIKQSVLDELTAMSIDVVALGGFDRAATSVNIAQKMDGVTKVAIANSVQDALSIAAIASAANEPILLTDKNALPASVEAFLTANTAITSSDVIGGTGIISNVVAAAVPNAVRHYGYTAYDTNNQVIQQFDAALALDYDNVYVASGVTGVDALAGAPLAAQTNSPIVLTDGTSVPAAAAFTHSKSSASTVVTALGGTAVVPEAVRAGIAAGNVNASIGDLAITSVSALDDTNTYLQIDFSKAVTTGLAPLNISIKDATTGASYGVKTVTLAANGLSAQLELFSNTDNTAVLKYLTDYTVTVQANGTTLTATFNRPAFSQSRVTAINVADKEFTAVNDKTGDEVTLTVPDGVTFDYQGSLGEVVSLWYNADNELAKSSVASVKSQTDAIEITGLTKIKLISADKKYDTTTDTYEGGSSTSKLAVYVDGSSTTMGAIQDQTFESAKVGFDKSGHIAYVSAYDLRDFLVVDNVNGDEVVGVEGDGTGGSFDASDATIVKDGQVVTLADLNKGDVLYFSTTANDGDGFAEVYSNTVTGPIDTVYNTSVLVNGKTYTYDYSAGVDELDSNAAVYIDSNGKTAKVDSDAAESLQAAGDVTLNLDRAGHLVYISGAVADVASNTQTAILTDDIQGGHSVFGKEQAQISALLQDGTEKVYDLTLEDLDTITIDGNDYSIDSTPAVGAADEWAPTTDGTNLNLVLTNGVDTDVTYSLTAEGNLVKFHLDDNGNVKELELFTTGGTREKLNFETTVKAGDSYVDGKQLLSSTLVFDANKDYDNNGDTSNIKAGDVTVTNWGAYQGTDISRLDYITNADNEVTAIVIRATTTSDTTYEEAVVTKVLRNTDDEIVSITAFVNGVEKTFSVDSVSNDLAKGDVAVLLISDNDGAFVTGILADGTSDTQYTTRVTTGEAIGSTDVNVGAREVTIAGNVYKLVSNGEVIDATDTSDITTGSLADLRGENNVTIVRDESGTTTFVKYFVINN